MDHGTLPLIESPNRNLGRRPFAKERPPVCEPMEFPKQHHKPPRRRKKQSPSHPPRLTALISLNKSRADLSLFLTMRGVRARAHKAVIDEAILHYNLQHPSCPYQERSPGGRNIERSGDSRGRPPETSVGGRSNSVQDAPPKDHVPRRAVARSPENRRTMMGLPAHGPAAQRVTEYTDAKLDRKLHQLESDRLRVLQEIERRVAATEAIQRAARVRQARKIVADKQGEAQRKKAAIQMQKVVRGHHARQRAMVAAERREQQERERLRVREEAARVRTMRSQKGGVSREQDAALRIQAVARGRRDRLRAGRIVRPFEFSCGGQFFKHTGRRNDTPTEKRVRPKLAQPQRQPKISHLSPEENRKMAYLEVPDDPEMEMFRLIDRDGDGYVSVADLEAYLSQNDAETDVNAIDLISAADLDGDGKLSPEEFMLLMVNSRKEVKPKKEPKKAEASAKVRRAQLIAKLQAKRDSDRQRYNMARF